MADGSNGSTGATSSGVVSLDGVDTGDGSDLFERMLKKERSREDNVSFRMFETLGVVAVRWSSWCEGSAVAVAFSLLS